MLVGFLLFFGVVCLFFAVVVMLVFCGFGVLPLFVYFASGGS